jgi:hypothetical protein
MHNGRLSVRPDLTGGGPQGIGRLQAMSGLNAFAAALAVSDVQVEATNDRPARNLGPVLFGGVIFCRRPAVVGTTSGKGTSITSSGGLVGIGRCALGP